MFRPANQARKSTSRQKIAAIIAGVAGGWFLVYLGTIIPKFFNFQPIASPGDVVFVFIFFGVSFGYFLGRAMSETAASFIFVIVFFAYSIISALIDWPPIFYGGANSQYAAAAAIPAIFLVALYVSGILTLDGKTNKLVGAMSTWIAFPLFWINIGYVFVYPLYLKLLASPTPNDTLVNLVVLAAMWVLIVPAGFYFLRKVFVK